MSILSTVVEAVTGGGIGAVVGTVAGIGEKIALTKMELKGKRDEYAHLQAMHRLNAEQQQRMARQDLLKMEVKGDTEIMTKSFDHDSITGDVSMWVNNVRALVRPASIVLGFAYMVYDPVNGAPLLSLMISWYFASRARTIPSL